MRDLQVRKIQGKESLDFILGKHYAQRKPSISFAFGLFENDIKVGILTIGKPASNALCEGVCGIEYKSNVYELNRLCVNDGLGENALSWFVGKCLKMLKGEDIVLVSYADEGMNHNGYIYQATNWIYTGKTKDRTDKYMPGNKHSRHYTEEFKHLRKYRSSKHRYIYFTSKYAKKNLRPLLKYKIESYPKGENKRYVLGERMKVKIINTNDNTVFYE